MVRWASGVTMIRQRAVRAAAAAGGVESDARWRGCRGRRCGPARRRAPCPCRRRAAEGRDAGDGVGAEPPNLDPRPIGRRAPAARRRSASSRPWAGCAARAWRRPWATHVDDGVADAGRPSRGVAPSPKATASLLSGGRAQPSGGAFRYGPGYVCVKYPPTHPQGVEGVPGRQVLRNVAEPVEIFSVVRLDETADHLAIDPVCQMAVDPDRAVGRLQPDGSAYYFCSLDVAGSLCPAPSAVHGVAPSKETCRRMCSQRSSSLKTAHRPP